MLPDDGASEIMYLPAIMSQCTYRCVVLPDGRLLRHDRLPRKSLNAPTGAWCSLTRIYLNLTRNELMSQCTYRCVVLPDRRGCQESPSGRRLNAPTGAWCSLTATLIYLSEVRQSLNAPTGAWCSLTCLGRQQGATALRSQCTYRCVVLPDRPGGPGLGPLGLVSMHLQVRGAP